MIEAHLIPDRAPTASILAVASDVRHRRDRESACALDFRVYGDGAPTDDFFGHPVTPVSHAERCVCSPPCSFDYDPRPYAEAEPADHSLYEGTGIAALYGLPGAEHHLSQLQGWNVRKESR